MAENISSYQAKTHLPALLRRVEAGESFTITRRGVEIAEIIPKRKAVMSVQEAVERLRARYEKQPRKPGKRPQYGARAALHEGHKY